MDEKRARSELVHLRQVIAYLADSRSLWQKFWDKLPKNEKEQDMIDATRLAYAIRDWGIEQYLEVSKYIHTELCLTVISCQYTTRFADVGDPEDFVKRNFEEAEEYLFISETYRNKALLRFPGLRIG